MYFINRITEFNPALVYGFDPESTFDEKNNFYFETGQHIDLLSAYLYAQDTILPFIKQHGIEKITEDMLLGWILQIHKHMGKHIFASFKQQSGEYSNSDVIRCQQGIDKYFVIADLINDLKNFDEHARQFIADYSTEHNLSVQTCSIFIEIIKRYRQQSLIKLSGKLDSHGKKLALITLDKVKEASRDENLSFDEKLALSKILTFCTPKDKIPQAMKDFSKMTLNLWQSLPGKGINEVATVVSEIFYGLTHIHPFGNCNGRTATCLMNIVLKSINLPDILLRYPGERNDTKSDYEKVMDVIDDTRQPFVKLIASRIKKAQKNRFQNPTLAQITKSRVSLSVRCQALEKILPSFSFEKLLGKVAQSGDLPSELSVEDQEILSLREALKILEGIEKTIPKPANSSIFSEQKNPLLLYKEALNYLNTMRYEQAIETLLIAITGYQKHADKNSTQIAKCYSALASSYRENDQFSLAVNACESALLSLEPLPNLDELHLISKKYAECLYLHKQHPRDVYKSSINNYRDKHYHTALLQLKYCINQWQTKPGNETKLGTAYSNMASSQQKLNNIEEAVKCCDIAIDFFTDNCIAVEDTQMKRNGILELANQLHDTAINHLS